MQSPTVASIRRALFQGLGEQIDERCDMDTVEVAQGGVFADFDEADAAGATIAAGRNVVRVCYAGRWSGRCAPFAKIAKSAAPKREHQRQVNCNDNYRSGIIAWMRVKGHERFGCLRKGAPPA